MGRFFCRFPMVVLTELFMGSIMEKDFLCEDFRMVPQCFFLWMQVCWKSISILSRDLFGTVRSEVRFLHRDSD